MSPFPVSFVAVASIQRIRDDETESSDSDSIDSVRDAAPPSRDKEEEDISPKKSSKTAGRDSGCALSRKDSDSCSSSLESFERSLTLGHEDDSEVEEDNTMEPRTTSSLQQRLQARREM